MKTQMRFQKILMLLTLIFAALTIVYAFGFCTGGIDYLAMSNGAYGYADEYNTQHTYDLAQSANDVFLWLGIVFIILAAFIYITATQRRRKYYVTNYVAIGAIVLYAIVWALVIIILVAEVHNCYLTEIDWVKFEKETNTTDFLYTKSTVMFWIGYVMAFLSLVIGGAHIFNLIWKIKLMKGEKALLEGGIVKEVA